MALYRISITTYLPKAFHSEWGSIFKDPELSMYELCITDCRIISIQYCIYYAFCCYNFDFINFSIMKHSSAVILPEHGAFDMYPSRNKIIMNIDQKLDALQTIDTKCNASS